jgi:hypothetical protein
VFVWQWVGGQAVEATSFAIICPLLYSMSLWRILKQEVTDHTSHRTRTRPPFKHRHHPAPTHPHTNPLSTSRLTAYRPPRTTSYAPPTTYHLLTCPSQRYSRRRLNSSDAQGACCPRCTWCTCACTSTSSTMGSVDNSMDSPMLFNPEVSCPTKLFK